MASAPSPDLTRHQLDELDALLQRMLNLPVAPAPQPAPPPPTPAASEWQIAPPRVTVEPASAPALWQEPPESDPDLSVPEPPATLRGVDAPATPAGFVSAFPADTDDDDDLIPLDTVLVPEGETAPTVPLLLWPLAVANSVLESLLGCCGPVGRWACRPGAKTVLGVTGLAMLAAAAMWTTQGPVQFGG